MNVFLICATVFLILALAAERKAAGKYRRALKHVIHVNGTRGKSAVTRLISAGLTAGGIRVFCKTTGTLPMTIGPDGTEQILHRRGGANILEQLKMLRLAAKSGAEVLVIECMAVDPELQWVSEHKMLKSDIGVITNARVDHVAEMGSTVEEVCDALCGTIPEKGILFTADADCFPRMQQRAAALGSRAILAGPVEGALPREPFPENTGLALAVCEALGVARSDALAGIGRVQKDPYAVSAHRLPGGAVFLNGMSANDPASTGLILDRFLSAAPEPFSRIVYILNCRDDRGYRTELMVDFLQKRKADSVYVMGKGRPAAVRKLKRAGIAQVAAVKHAAELRLEGEQTGTLLYAIGNIAGEGMELAEFVKKEGISYVQ